MLADVADIRIGPQIRRGIAEFDGQGEVVGGIVVMRWDENALNTIEAVKTKLDVLKRGLPDDVEITAPLVSMVLIPVLYIMWRSRQLPRGL